MQREADIFSFARCGSPCGYGATDVISVSQQHIYGSSRLGYREKLINMSTSLPTDHKYSRTLGEKRYEMVNHLGNVLAVITDRHKGIETTADVYSDKYLPDVIVAQDYDPGGMILPGRVFSSSSYRYGYNQGSEKDDEISGEGNSFTTFYRQGDTRLLTWWSVDPMAAQQPWQSPYSYMNGNPVLLNDPNGDFALIDDFVIGFVKDLFQKRSNFKDPNKSRMGNALSSGGQHFINSAKIWGSFGATDKNLTTIENAGKIASRFTLELPQQLLGITVAHIDNIIGIQEIDYRNDGTVHVETTMGGTNSIWDLTLGNIITTSDLSQWESNLDGLTLMDGTPLQDAARDIVNHGKGHTMQSSRFGPLFLPAIALPSVITAPFSFHNKMPWEKGADNLFQRYQQRHDSSGSSGTSSAGDFDLGSIKPENKLILGSEKMDR